MKVKEKVKVFVKEHKTELIAGSTCEDFYAEDKAESRTQVTDEAESRTQVTDEADTMLKELSQEFGKSENDILLAALKLYKYVMEFKDEHE